MTIPRYGNASELLVRGYALPYNYFYRGSIEIKESFDDAEIGDEQDIKGVLAKLKEVYYPDTIMMKPDDEIEVNQREKETCCHESDDQSKMEANESTEKSDEMDRITSITDSSNSISIPILDTLSSATSNTSLTRKRSVQSAKNVTDFKSLLKKSVSRFTSEAEIVNMKQAFQFSKLDDGPLGKGSFLDIDPYKIRNTLSSLSSSNSTKVLIRPPFDSFINEECILEATSKLITFINEKEREYYISNQNV